MQTKVESGRDAFTFSLHGMTTIASFAAAPVIADDRINRAMDRRFTRDVEPRSAVRIIEDFLGRYFAAGCCDGA